MLASAMVAVRRDYLKSLTAPGSTPIAHATAISAMHTFPVMSMMIAM